MDGFVTAYSTVTGKPQRVPEHYLDHPVLGRNLTLTPPATPAGEYPEGTPSVEWTAAQLQAYATGHDIDLAGSKASKADMVAAITASGVDPQ